MLQPRDIYTHRRKSRLHSVANYWAIFIVAIFVGSNHYCSAQVTENEFAAVQPTKALRSDGSDVTTVLLVDNNNRSSHGRFLNVKPAVGLLTSTARTFIQEGVTTEYATKVLGTTLDNGRLYAQLLTKSSRVLYDHENSPNPTKSYYSQLNDIVSDSDEGGDWPHNRNDYDNPVTFIKNTDYISPNQPLNAFLVYPTARQSPISENDEVVDYRRNEKKEIVMADHIRAEALVDRQPENTLESVQNVKESFSVSKSSSQGNQENDGKIKIKVDKVQPANNLATYTIKNEFAPSGFSWDEQDYDVQTEKQFMTTADKRNGKMLYQADLPKEERKLPTVTYFGFADFTTIVGDTVIVFSPQTASPVNVGQITSIKGDATLHNDPAVVVSTVKTFLSHEPGMVTETVKGHTINMETTLPTMVIEPVTPYRQSKGEDEMGNSGQTTPLSPTDKYEVTTISDEMIEEMMEKEIEEGTQRIHTVSPNMIQPSEITSSSVTYSKPSDDDIAKALASIASVKAAQEHTATEPLETQFVASETKVSGGVTTIFFEDDPFDQFFQTSQTSEQSIEPTPSSVIEVPVKSSEPVAENEVEVTTIGADLTTTEESLPEPTTFKQSDSVNDEEEEEADVTTIAPKIDEIVNDKKETVVAKETEDAKAAIPSCVEDSILSSSTHLKTLTYLTTYFIPFEDTTTTSIHAREVISTDVNYACIAPTSAVIEPIVTTAVIDIPEVKKEATTVPINKAEKEEETTEAVMQISTESSVTEATSKANDSNEKKIEADDAGEDDEIELIYKTLYTTYTYLTTFFHESTSSISSRKEVVTNVITSTLDMGQLSTDDALSNLVAQMGGKDAIQPTSVGIGRPTTSFQPNENNLHGFEDVFLEGNRDVQATPALDTQNLDLSDIKTYYTTYTYFTTIFVDGETEISSRTEVYTNYVGNTITPTAMVDVAKETTLTRTYDDSDDVENNILEHTSPVKSYDNTIRRNPSGQSIVNEDSTETSTESDDEENNVIQPSYSTMLRSGDASSVDDNTETPITMVTDVKSSSSDGDRQIIENVNRQWNGLLEDQISSESNTEEIVPSPTLLLQTSYTTFTYFTTMYIGKSSSNILSRLETVTNVVTETLQPSRAVQEEEASLPITYFTTFTYWTTLYKDGAVTTTSREETISNVISPSVSIEPTTVVEPILATTIPTLSFNDEDAPPAQVVTTMPSSLSTVVNASEPTTYYTTYTYFTTLYVGEDTVLNSRFETVTNVVEPTVTPSARAINLDNTKNAIPAEKIQKTKVFAPAYVPTPVNEPIEPTQPAVVNSEPTGIISLNQGKIIDAEGISTIFYTTKAVGSNINGLYAQVIESTSSVKVDEAKKAAQTSSTPEVPGSRVHKTGLVRLIEGTIVSNRTTTLYESKVIGTVIDGRYAQVIESTSSFLIEKTLEPTGVLQGSIKPTATVSIASTNIISPTSSVVQGSISENGDDETTEEGYEDDEEGEDDGEEDDGTGKKKSRLTFQSRKRTFTPVIRPFASRARPTFAPKRKNLSPSSATIITRSDFTPTITATPAIKSESSRGRFTSNKRQSSSISVPNSSVASSSSSRRFSRPSRTSVAPGSGLPSSTLPRSRSSASSRIQPTSTSLPGSSSRRPNIFRASSPIARPSILPSNSRFRINPTQSSSFNRGGPSSSINTTPHSADVEESDEDNLTTNVTNFPTDTTGDDEVQTTTENNRRNQNPLLRFRRPLSSGRAQSINTVGTTSRPVTITTRRSPLLGRGRTTSTTSTTTTTPKPKPRSFQRPAFTPQSPSTLPGTRTRPGSNLFPPRSLFRPSTANQDLDKEDESSDNQLSDENKDINDLANEGEANAEDNTDDSNTRDTRENKKYTVGFRKRVKRQVDYGTRTNSYSSRYRRPTPISRSIADESEEQEIQTTRPKVTTIGRFTPNDRTSRLQNVNSNANSANKNSQSNNRIRPTSSSIQSGRAQFTLREKDNLSTNSRSNFRRGNSNSYSSTNRRKTPTTVSSRPKSPRLRNYSGIVTESPYNSRNTNSRSRASRGRPTSRTRSRNGQDNLDYAIQPSFDGTITVTHHVPTEITIPVVNGKVTEYKNILTAKVSTEVLGPKQYSTTVGSNGKNVIVLNNEITGIGSLGATEITQFFLQETPTTSIIFTPTTIRGRKTSFSHVVPSTVYNVEEVISTIQPQIAANAPLANILLSQLLLGNLGIPQQQQQINPLLGVAQPMIQQGPAVPQTEFKVRTTTYVTTVTNVMSTVIPLTFRGKEILTTIVDNSVDVITATEFLTDTIVSTPTVVQQPQQINSLFLNQLLLQQQQQQAQPQQLLQPLTNDPIAQNLFNEGVKVDSDDSTQSNKLYSADVDDREYDDYAEQDQLDNVPTVNKFMVQRKSNRKYNNNRAQISQSPLESSVITLYVSGRRPGEFSTVLSTVISTPDSSLQKRAVVEYEEVKPSVSINDIDLYESEGSDIDEYILPASDIRIESSIDDNHSETASLESIIGDVSKYINMNGDISKMETPSTIDNGRALGFGLYMMDSNNNGDEARYNLATRIMSNGVEVIVAGDKSTLPGEPNVLRILPSSHYKQTTLPASTLKGDHMVMMLPDNLEIDELSSSLYDLNKFVTRTCLTTYTFLTTYLQDGTTTVESREKVISNTATEERNLLKISPTPTAGLTFTQTPKLAIGTFPTTYTYLNTIFDGDQPIVLTSKHTVTNTITAPDDYLSLLQPSESVTAIHDTNTYYSTVALTKTIHDDDQTKLISTDTVFTQIVITESLPSKMTSVMTSYVAFDVDDPLSNELKDLATTDVVKTYYVTYTYLNTLLDNGSMIVRTNVSTSSDIVTEKLYLYSKRTEAVQATTPPHVIDSKPSKPFDSINIYATKTYLTTFTYFTTLLQVNSNERHGSSTVVDSHTNIVENVITESIPNSLFPTESLSSYYSAVQTAKNPNGIVTLATLLEGQTLEVTAVAPSETIKMSSTTKVVDKLVEENVDDNIIPDDASVEAQPATSNTNGGLQNNKIEKIDNPVSDLIGSFNLNSLTAFGPMFNALTGLIQNNFAKNSNDRNTTIVRHVRNGTTTIKDENGENIVPAALNDISGRNPIYIPVGGIGDEDIESAESQNIQLPQLNSFVPPSPPSVKWINDNGKQELVIGKPSPLLNGIAISPGEVITANSDVIIGRPTVGVSPRIPLHSDLDDNSFLDPPPIQPLPHHPNKNIRDSIPLQSIQTESYIGPPPPLQQQNQKSRPNVHKNQIHDSHRPPVIPFNNIQKDRGHQETRLSNSKNILSNSFLHPPPLKSQVNYHQEHQFRHKPSSPNVPSIPFIQSNDHHHSQPQINHHKPKQQPQQLFNHYQQQQLQIIPAIPAQSHPNVPPLKQDTLFEIQRIPEVFSTDLPPIHVLEYPIEPSLQAQVPHPSTFLPLPEIQQSTGQSLLVDIQPSQIANVIIPHGSTTALIYGGANELHKNGQYFDEPSPYIDADINLFYTNKPNKTNSNVINVDVPHNHQNTHVNIKPHRPIAANHEINMNANVLSQDVDLHAPPIKFTLKEENYAQHPSVNLNQHHDFNGANIQIEHEADIDNVVSSSIHKNEHRPVLAQGSTSTTPSDLTDLFNQQSNYVVPHYNGQDFNRQPNRYNYYSQNNGEPNQININEHIIHNSSYVSNNIQNENNYYHKNSPNVIEYNGPPPSRQRQRPNVAPPNEVNTKSQSPPFYHQYYPQQHVNRPTGTNTFFHSNVPQQSQSNRPTPGRIVNYEQPPQVHQKPVYINLHEHVDSYVTQPSNAPSVEDVIVDEHKDDDLENEEGEVIQESNSVPVVPGQRPKDVFNVEVPTSSPKTMFYEIHHPSSYGDNRVINTQTESNHIWNVSDINNLDTGIIGNKKPIRYPTAPPAILINELSPNNLYPSTTVPPINKNRQENENRQEYGNGQEYGNRQEYGNGQEYGNIQEYGKRHEYGNHQEYGNRHEYGNHRRPTVPVRPLERPPLHPQGSSNAIIYGGTKDVAAPERPLENPSLHPHGSSTAVIYGGTKDVAAPERPLENPSLHPHGSSNTIIYGGTKDVAAPARPLENPLLHPHGSSNTIIYGGTKDVAAPARPLQNPPMHPHGSAATIIGGTKGVYSGDTSNGNVLEPRPSLQPPPRPAPERQPINLPRPSLEPPTQRPSTNPFVVSKNTIGFSKNRLQISMPIDTTGLDFLPSLGQTEKPFNPQYTSTAKGNPFVTRIPTSFTTVRQTTTMSSTLSSKTTTTSTTPLPSTSPEPTTTKAAVRRPVEKIRFGTQTTQNAGSKVEISLNTGEITTKKPIENYVTTDESEPSGGIFHVQESINPHNFAFVNEGKLPNRINHHHHRFDAQDDKSKQQQDNLKLNYPEPSADMMPPPPTKYHENIVPTSTEEVMGLNPPPLPTNEVISQGGIKSSTLSPPYTQISNATTQNGFRPTNRPYRYENVYRPPQRTETTTIRTRTRGTTNQPYQPVTRGTLKPIPLLEESETNSDLSVQKPPRIYENRRRPDIRPTPSVTAPKNSIISPQANDDKPDLQNQENTRRYEGHNRQYTQLNTKYRLPSEILILGTEQSLNEDQTSSSSTTSLPTRRTQILTKDEYKTISSTPISTERTIGTNAVETPNDSVIDQPANSDTTSSLLKTKSPLVILPTRYITNTKTLTVTTTKTTVIRSQGITTTLTLTLTKTSTIIDTITHQITHTLVQPTIVTTSLMPEDKIVATSTVQEVPVFSHYPSFPGQSNLNYGDNAEHHPTFLEDEANLDEFIINYDEEIKVKKSSKPQQNVSQANENESIFVVMTDQKQPSIININPSMIDKPHRINAMSDNDKLNEIEDSGDSNNDDVVNRDEDDMTKDVNNVLLGGILIASPPRSDTPKMFNTNECRPDCKASRNELCQKIEGHMKCVCRPGFARMFPDRPCKPTYTYTISLPLVRHGSEKLTFEEALTKNTSPKYTHLSQVVHDGLDRMVMQSDLRDIYHGVHLIEFRNSSAHKHPEIDQQADGSGLTSVFYLQLSDNYDDMRLLDIFHKYLQNNNYSLGGTDLYSSNALIDDMTATDFDECVNFNTKFNDCSEDAHCFNLRGTYTCSCKEGFADLSGNPIYPGRICSAELIGCEKCNYHGTCYSRGDDQMLCECFQWYAGNNCHVNLKVMLIALITVGLILFFLLLICLIMTCCKRKRPNNRTLVGMGLVSNKLVTNQRTMDRRAMIQETSSETSDDTHTLPYDRNKQNQLNKSRQSSSNLSLNNKFTIATQNSSAGHSGTLGMEQKDRSLTVMIPRAKYHPAAPPPPPIVVATTRYNMDSAPSVCSTTEAKLLSYLDASPTATNDHPRKKSTTNPLNKHGALNTTSTGALISAGFEVSATVGTENDLFEKIWLYNKLKSDEPGFQQLQDKSIKSDDVDSRHQDAKTEVASTITGNGEKVLMSPMGEWMDIDTHNEMTMSEARSYYETTIQPSTKTFRHTAGSNKAPSRNNEEANTMAERDLGSTFLLPHTHLYKPDRGSDISGFDSL